MSDRQPPGASARRNIAWLSTERVIQTSLQVVTAIVVIRYLGPSDLGVIVTVESVAAILVSIQMLGLDPLVMEAVDLHDQNRAERVFGTALMSRAAIGVVLIIGLVLSASAVENTDIAVGLVLASAIIIALPFDTFRLALDARRQSRVYVRRRIMVMVLHVLVQLVLVLLAADVIAFIAVSVAALAARFLVSAFRMPERPAFKHFDTSVLRRAIPLLLASLAAIVYRRIDIVMITAISGVSEAGLYGAAIRVAELPYFIPVSIATTYFLAIRDSRESPSPGGDALGYATALVSGALIVAVVGVMAVGAPLLPVLLGEEYRGSVPMLLLAAPSMLFVGWGILRHRWLVVHGLERHSAIAATLGALLNIGLNLVLIPLAGGTGAALATLLTYGLVLYGYSLAVPACRPAAQAIHQSFSRAPHALLDLIKQGPSSDN